MREIWRAFGLKPWRADSFKVSPDPDLVEKIRDLVGLYMSPPVAAAVFAIDEKPQIQALNRTAPTLPMLPTTPARATHDYERNGTCDLFAALNVATGTVITDIRKSHTSADFIAFLNKVNREVPAELDVHVILDNLQTHKTPQVHRWLLRHRRFHFHFTPTYGSWMNLVERWFSALTTKKLKRSRPSQRQRTGRRHLGLGRHLEREPEPIRVDQIRRTDPRTPCAYCAAINASACPDFTALQDISGRGAGPPPGLLPARPGAIAEVVGPAKPSLGRSRYGDDQRGEHQRRTRRPRRP